VEDMKLTGRIREYLVSRRSLVLANSRGELGQAVVSWSVWRGWGCERLEWHQFDL